MWGVLREAARGAVGCVCVGGGYCWRMGKAGRVAAGAVSTHTHTPPHPPTWCSCAAALSALALAAKGGGGGEEGEVTDATS